MKRKLLAACLLAGCVLTGAASCGGDNPVNPPIGETEEQKAVVTFEGKVTLKNTEHAVTVKGFKDNKFELTIADVNYTKNGTYEFLAGIGYKFTFSNGDVCMTTFDAAKKDHVLTVKIKAGDAGSGEAVLKLHDDKFVLDEGALGKNAFVQRANFVGTLSGEGGKKFTFKAKLNEGGALEIDAGIPMLNKTGTWTFENNKFVFTVEGKNYESTFDLGTSTYTIPYETKSPAGTHTVNLTWNATEMSFTGRNSAYGGINCNVYVYGNHTALFDIECDQAPNEKYNVLFDRVLTWSTKKGIFTFTYTDKDGKQDQFTATVNPETKELNLPYFIILNSSTTGVQKIEFPCKGNVEKMPSLYSEMETQFGPVTALFAFKDKGIVSQDVDGAGQASTMFDEDGTYTFENNVITCNFKNDRTFTSTWDEKTGTYSLPISIKGQITLESTLTYSLWGTK